MESLPLLLKHITCFAIFFIMLWISSINKSHRLFIDQNRPAENPGNVIAIQLTGLLWLGLIPGLVTEHSLLKVMFGNNLMCTFLGFAVIIGATIGIIGIFSQTWLFVEVIRRDVLAPLSSTNLMVYLTARIGFVIFCEIWFRGLFLQDSIAQLGIPLAVTLNIFIYALMHSFGTRKEIIVSIPYCLILCMIAIYMHAVWLVILIQLVNALANDWRSILRFYKHLKPSI
jgi:membrane protease YdiL (CAAX protease family)